MSLLNRFSVCIMLAIRDVYRCKAALSDNYLIILRSDGQVNGALKEKHQMHLTTKLFTTLSDIAS